MMIIPNQPKSGLSAPSSAVATELGEGNLRPPQVLAEIGLNRHLAEISPTFVK
jgi:hypothetical protein